jgi:hypothetical protein
MKLSLVLIQKHYILFSIAVVIVLGLVIGLPLGLLLNKSSSSASQQAEAQKTQIGWHQPNSTIIRDLTDPNFTYTNVTSLPGPNINIATLAFNNDTVSLGYDPTNPNFDTRIINPSSAVITQMLGSLKLVDANTSTYGFNLLYDKNTKANIFIFGQV